VLALSCATTVQVSQRCPHARPQFACLATRAASVVSSIESTVCIPSPTNAYGLGPQPHPLYSVRFEPAEVWGPSADGPGHVYIDLEDA
jgi:hypothetical protein